MACNRMHEELASVTRHCMQEKKMLNATNWLRQRKTLTVWKIKSNTNLAESAQQCKIEAKDN